MGEMGYQNFPKCPTMSLKCLKMSQSVKKCQKIMTSLLGKKGVRYFSKFKKWPKMAKNGQKWPKMAKNGKKCP